jgi:hypothetical protein
MRCGRIETTCDLTLTAGADLDHFREVTKMVLRQVPGDLAGCPGLGEDVLKILPSRIAQQHLDVPRQPLRGAAR